MYCNALVLSPFPFLLLPFFFVFVFFYDVFITIKKKGLGRHEG